MPAGHPSQQHGFVNTPVYRGSTVLFPTYHDLVTRNAHFSYGTQGSPTTEALTEAWTEFSGAAGTVLAPTGLAAITLALLAAVKAGDHILVTDSVYRPSRIFCDGDLARMGVETTYFDPLVGARRRGADARRTPASCSSRRRARRASSCRTFPPSPRSRARKAPASSSTTPGRRRCFSRRTNAAPIWPIEAGTKYLSGHSDLLLGLVSATPSGFPASRRRPTPSPCAPAPRMCFSPCAGCARWSCACARPSGRRLDIAQWLEGRAEVAAVLHPALPSCPRTRAVEAGFSRLFGTFLGPSRAGPAKGGRGHAGRTRAVRHGLLMGRL